MGVGHHVKKIEHLLNESHLISFSNSLFEFLKNQHVVHHPLCEVVEMKRVRCLSIPLITKHQWKVEWIGIGFLFGEKTRYFHGKKCASSVICCERRKDEERRKEGKWAL